MAKHFLSLLLCFFFLVRSSAQDTNRIALTDLGVNMYKSYPGGLYPDGKNIRPYSHDSAGRAIARALVPLKKDGSPDPAGGTIVLLSIGMSNTTMEFSVFKQIADSDRTRNPRLTIVDGAQGGQTASIISNSAAPFWSIVDQRLAAAGVSPQQVQIAWIKEADSNPTQAFPVHAQKLSSELETITRILKTRYPNLKLAFLSSRIYGGYATTSLNPEPYAYESGFSVKWVIDKQLNGDTSLAFSGSRLRSPWLAWGPYCWANGMIPRSDGLIWDKSDFVTSDYTHPSSTGAQKVARMLLAFFKEDPAAAPWFLSQPTSVYVQENINPEEYSLSQNFPNPFNSSTTFRFSIPRRSRVKLEIRTLLGSCVTTLIEAEKEAGTYQVPFSAQVASGVYFFILEVISTSTPGKPYLIIRKLTVLK